MLIETIGQSNPLSTEVFGTDLSQSNARAQTSTVTVQVQPVTDSDFTVALQAAIDDGDDTFFVTIGTFKRGDLLLQIFPISTRAVYRFGWMDGVDCKVKLAA